MAIKTKGFRQNIANNHTTNTNGTNDSNGIRSQNGQAKLSTILKKTAKPTLLPSKFIEKSTHN